MTVFRPRDHKGALLDLAARKPAVSTRGRQFTLLQMMKAVLIVAVILAIAVQGPDLLVLQVLGLFLLIFAVCLYGLSRLPFRVRLTIELATATFLLVLSAWIWRPPFYIAQAERTEEVARLCSTLADVARDARSRELFRREAAEYDRRAMVLRIQGMWYGLIRSATKQDPVPLTDRELILELGLLESRDRHLRMAEEMGVPGIQPGP